MTSKSDGPTITTVTKKTHHPVLTYRYDTIRAARHRAWVAV